MKPLTAVIIIAAILFMQMFYLDWTSYKRFEASTELYNIAFDECSKNDDFDFDLFLKRTERIDMYDSYFDQPWNDTEIINGVYFPSEDYYCVWTGDRDPHDINNTDNHELCHAFVDQDWKHFCGRFVCNEDEIILGGYTQ